MYLFIESGSLFGWDTFFFLIFFTVGSILEKALFLGIFVGEMMISTRVGHGSSFWKFLLVGISIFFVFYFCSPVTLAMDFDYTDEISRFTYRFNLSYFLIYPLIRLAGLTLDNSLVFGSAFGFDGILRSLWNIMKNIANFGLGFVFLYQIFKMIFENTPDRDKVFGIIKNTLIAGVGIQISWFVLTTLVDISTIATYGVGGLPITVSTEATQKKIPVYGNSITLDPTDTQHFFTTKHQYIPSCNVGEVTVEGQYTGTAMVIKGPTELTYEGSSDAILSDFCHYQSSVYHYNGVRLLGDTPTIEKLNEVHSKVKISYDQILEGSYLYVNGTLLDADNQSPALNSLLMIPIGTAPEGETSVNFYGQYSSTTLDQYLQEQGGDDELFDLKGLLESSRSYLGVFQSFYSSLLQLINFSDHTIGIEGGTMHRLITVLIELLYLAALIIPLLVIVIVLGWRILMLWLVIIFSPLIVLVNALKIEHTKLSDNFKFKDLELFKIQDILSAIFAPVIICFVVSLSTVLMNILITFHATIYSGDTPPIEWDALTLDQLLIKVKGFSQKFSTTLVGLFGVVLSWFMIFAAIKSTSVGKKIGADLQAKAENLLKNAPIIPFKGQTVSFNSLKDNKSNVFKDLTGIDITPISAMTEDYYKDNTLQDLFDVGFAKEDTKSQKAFEKFQQHLTSSNSQQQYQALNTLNTTLSQIPITDTKDWDKYNTDNHSFQYLNTTTSFNLNTLMNDDHIRNIISQSSEDWAKNLMDMYTTKNEKQNTITNGIQTKTFTTSDEFTRRFNNAIKSDDKKNIFTPDEIKKYWIGKEVKIGTDTYTIQAPTNHSELYTLEKVSA